MKQKEKILNNIGSSVDNIFLTLPKILNPIRPIRDVNRATYEKELDYYFENGYIDDPESFFTFPDKMPVYSIIDKRRFKDGMCQVISYSSHYEPRNSLIRERFHSFEANRTGYIVRWTHGDKGRKTVLCLHGFMLGDPKQAEKMFKVRKLYEMGLDVALFITPFHWKRAPESKALKGMFLQPEDAAMTCECFGQAMYDLYSTCMILRDMEAADIGIVGGSLGGYNASLFICLQNIVSFAAMMVPAVTFSSWLEHPIKLPFKIDAPLMKKITSVWELHSPLQFSPKISKERILLIASRGDRLCPFEYMEKLCEKWDWPRHKFLTGGHWLIFDGKERGREWYDFLGDMDFCPGEG